LAFGNVLSRLAAPKRKAISSRRRIVSGREGFGSGWAAIQASSSSTRSGATRTDRGRRRQPRGRGLDHIARSRRIGPAGRNKGQSAGAKVRIQVKIIQGRNRGSHPCFFEPRTRNVQRVTENWGPTEVPRRFHPVTNSASRIENCVRSTARIIGMAPNHQLDHATHARVKHIGPIHKSACGLSTLVQE
jgi:hypothetical protein